MNILIGIITSDKKNYCWEEFSSSLRVFSHQILFVDNSRDHGNRHMIEKAGFECLHVNPKGKDLKKVMAESHELLRKEALKRNCDLMHLESDIILRPTDIDKLYNQDKPVVGFPYFVGFGRDMKLMIQKLEEYPSKCMSVSYPYINTMPKGDIEQVFHCGLGAVLIANWVLKEFRFRWQGNEGELHPDTFFAYDLFYKQIPIYCDTSRIVTHLNKQLW